MHTTTPLIVKSFTQDPAQGNPTAVYIMQENLSDAKCLDITRSTGFSECVFIKITNDIPTLRFFSPEKEMGMCGHATLAAAHVLKDTHRPNILKTKSGDIKIHYRDSGLIEMEITTKPRYYDDCISADRIAQLLGIEQSAIIGNAVKISVGTPKVLVELDSASIL